MATWLSRKYNVAPEPLAALVAEAFAAGPRTKIDPLLIMAVMAVESGFNPYAQWLHSSRIDFYHCRSDDYVFCRAEG